MIEIAPTPIERLQGAQKRLQNFSRKVWYKLADTPKLLDRKPKKFIYITLAGGGRMVDPSSPGFIMRDFNPAKRITDARDGVFDCKCCSTHEIRLMEHESSWNTLVESLIPDYLKVHSTAQTSFIASGLTGNWREYTMANESVEKVSPALEL